jgi:hypothetical protein
VYYVRIKISNLLVVVGVRIGPYVTCRILGEENNGNSLVNDNRFYGAENRWRLGYLVENRMQNYGSLYCVNRIKKYS